MPGGRSRGSKKDWSGWWGRREGEGNREKSGWWGKKRSHHWWPATLGFQPLPKRNMFMEIRTLEPCRDMLCHFPAVRPSLSIGANLPHRLLALNFKVYVKPRFAGQLLKYPQKAVSKCYFPSSSWYSPCPSEWHGSCTSGKWTWQWIPSFCS